MWTRRRNEDLRLPADSLEIASRYLDVGVMKTTVHAFDRKSRTQKCFPMGIQRFARGFRARLKKGHCTFNGPLRGTEAAAVEDEKHYKEAASISSEKLHELHETLHGPSVHIQKRGNTWRARIIKDGQYYFGPCRAGKELAESDAKQLLQAAPDAVEELLQELRGVELVERKVEGFEAVMRLHLQSLLLGNISVMSKTEQKRLQRARQQDEYKTAFEACELLVKDQQATEMLAQEPDASWLRELGMHLRLESGSRLLGTAGFDALPAHCGLRNLGNSCWLNATVQCLFHCPPLQKDLSDSEADNGPLGRLLRELFQKISSKEWDYVAPFHLLHQIYKTRSALFSPGESADAGDCCELLLSACMSSREVGGGLGNINVSFVLLSIALSALSYITFLGVKTGPNLELFRCRHFSYITFAPNPPRAI